MRINQSITLLCATLATVYTASVNVSSLSPALAVCPVLSTYPSGVSSTVNLFPVQATPTISSDLFTIQYSTQAKLITNTLTGEQYILNLNGNPNKADNNTFGVSLNSNVRTFTIPFQHVCIAETLVETYIEMLGERSSILYDVLDYTTSPCIILAGKEGLINPYNSTDNTKCDAVWGNTATNDASAGGGNNVISFSVDLATTMLGRAEWIKFVSAFYDKEAAAVAIYNSIQSRYNNLKSLAQQAAANNKQVIAWIAYNPAYTSATYNSSTSYTVSTAAYKQNLTGDAGAIFFTPPASYNSTNGYSSAVELFDALQAGNVTQVIDETYAYIYNANGTASDAFTSYNTWLQYINITSAAASKYAFLQHVWRDDKSQTATNLTAGIPGQDDWFESAYPNADAVLADVVSFVQPSVEPNYNTRWFRSLNNGTPVTIIATCPTPSDLSAPSIPILDPNNQTEYSTVQCPTFLTQPQSLLATSNADTNTISYILATTLATAVLLM